MSEALGDRLREAREARGMTLEQLASVTRLNPLFIKALENGRWDLLPGQVYLKPFVKSCAEALGLDLKELYRLIDGGKIERPSDQEGQFTASRPGRRFDYRLPVVAVVGLIIIALIYLTVKSSEDRMPDGSETGVVPAGSGLLRREASWNRPWERPAGWETGAARHRLRLEASDTVWACILADGDTTFDGFLNPGDGRTFISMKEFKISLGRNDCLSAYLDGARLPEIGSGKPGPYSLLVGPLNERSDLER